MPARLLLFPGLALALVLTWTATAAAAEFLEPLAPGVYLHRGKHADIDSPDRADSANLGVVIGARCVAVIDTGGAVATGTALRAAIRALTDRPVCYVINTHVHFDHVLGNAAFVADGAEFIGQSHLPEEMAASRDFFIENFAAELGEPPSADKVVAATRTVADVLSLDLGDRELRLVAAPRAHSVTDLIVLDERSGTLFAGDLLFRERLPVIDGSLKGWLAWLDGASATPYARVVPGHGPVDEAWPAGAAAERAYLQALLGEIRAGIAAGMTLEEAQDKVASATLAGWQLTGRAHRLNVSRAYRELEWE